MNKGSMALNILSAIGGAILLLLGQIALAEYQRRNANADRQLEQQAAARQQRSALLDSLFDQFGAMSPIPRRAGLLIQTGQGGSTEDVWAVINHFRRVMTYLVNDRVGADQVSRYYGGRLDYWSARFNELATGVSPVATRFAQTDRDSLRLLASALREIRAQAASAESNQAGPAQSSMQAYLESTSNSVEASSSDPAAAPDAEAMEASASDRVARDAARQAEEAARAAVEVNSAR